MTSIQLNFFMQRFIKDLQKYNGVEPQSVKAKNDFVFCKKLFGDEKVNYACVTELLNDAIFTKNELELDLLLMLLSHFNCVNHYCITLSQLLIQPWHHFHDRIASMLEFDADERIIENLRQAAVYRCDNLAYESDCCEFNRKCLFTLARIGTQDAIKSIKDISGVDDPIIANHALEVMKQYNLI